MNFTPTPPTQPGFYVWKMYPEDKDFEIDLRNLYLVNGVLLDDATLETPETVGGLWCKLIPET